MELDDTEAEIEALTPEQDAQVRHLIGAYLDDHRIWIDELRDRVDRLEDELRQLRDE